MPRVQQNPQNSSPRSEPAAAPTGASSPGRGRWFMLALAVTLLASWLAFLIWLAFLR